jgi:hypothetical protein
VNGTNQSRGNNNSVLVIWVIALIAMICTACGHSQSQRQFIEPTLVEVPLSDAGSGRQAIVEAPAAADWQVRLDLWREPQMLPSSASATVAEAGGR